MMTPLKTAADLALIERVQQLFNHGGPQTALWQFRLARADWIAAWHEVVNRAIDELVVEGFDEAELLDARDCMPAPNG